MIGIDAMMGKYDAAIIELDALEQAIVDICLPDIVREIQERKRMILKR